MRGVEISSAAAPHASVFPDVSVPFGSARTDAFGSSAPSRHRLPMDFWQRKVVSGRCTKEPLSSRQCLQPRRSHRSRVGMGNYGKPPALAGELISFHRGDRPQTVAPGVLLRRAEMVDCRLKQWLTIGSSRKWQLSVSLSQYLYPIVSSPDSLREIFPACNTQSNVCFLNWALIRHR